MQNGIDSLDMIARHVPRKQIAAGAIFIAAHIAEPGVIVHVGDLHTMTVDAMAGDPTMAAFFAACDKATGIVATPTDEPGHVVWRKFIVLVAFSGVTSITRLPIGFTFANPDTLAFMRRLVAENIAVANACGENFDPLVVEEILAIFSGQPFGQKSSMLVDLENGRRLELPWLSGRVHALGEQHDIPTPANSAVWAALLPHVGGPPKARDGRAVG